MINDDVTRIQQRAQFFINNNLKAFIIDKSSDTYHFCHIKDYDNAVVRVIDFKGKNVGTIQEILIIDIEEIKLYKDKQ